ncbi:TIGR00366 family protein [Rickettsiales bacterium]|nr:TIGR00366 family protein [Rickettsiales bacterium]
MSFQRIRTLDGIAKPFVKLVEKCYPDAFIFVIILSVLTYILAIFIADASHTETIMAWGDGLPKLFTFTAQITLIMIGAHALAHTEPVEKFLYIIGGIPKTSTQAYALVTFCSGCASLVAWSLGLIVGGIVSKYVALGCLKKKIKIHYPLLVASAYSGYVIWHMGYSSSSALFVSTPGHMLEDKIGVLPVTETIFSSFNISLALFTLLIITLINPLMKPKDKEEIIEIKQKVIKKEIKVKSNIQINQNNKNLLYNIENKRYFSTFLGLVLLFYIFFSYYLNGFFLTLSFVSFTFLGVGLLLSNSPMHFVKLVNNASQTVGPIILQYPFYAGIMGIMGNTELLNVIADWITSISTKETLGFYSFLSAGIVNMFIPSGGGQWAVQGPVMIEAAKALDVDPRVIVLSVSYGDQWTNMIQPFWTIPLLAIAGLHMRQIMGYTFVIFIVTGLIYSSGTIYMGYNI